MERHKIYGPVRALPTKTFFYGMEPGEEITAEIDPGKTLEIRLQAVGETDDKGDVRVFFELNGQPRIIRVPNRLIKSQTASNPKAEEGNNAHVGAPMPGVIAGVTVSKGQSVNEGGFTSYNRSHENGDRSSCRTRRRYKSGSCEYWIANRR